MSLRVRKMIMKSVAITVVGTLSLMLAFVGGGYQIVGTELLTLQTMLTTISLWEALEIVSTILVPFAILFLTGLGKLVWSMHKRLKRLESSQGQHAKTLYGDSDDVMHDGLSKEMRDLKVKVTNIESMLDKISRNLDGDDDDDE